MPTSRRPTRAARRRFGGLALLALAPAALAQGLPRLLPPRAYDLPALPVEVLLADVTGDGHADVLVTHDAPPSISVLVNGGAGAFGAPVVTALPDEPRAWTSGDLDGDDRVDVVLVDDGVVRLRALLGTRSGALAAGGTLDLPGLVNTSGAVVLQADGDGLADVALNTHGGVHLARGDGTGGFLSLTGPFAPTPPELVTPAFSVHVTDVNGDGQADLVTPGWFVWGYGFVVFAGDGAGGFVDQGQSPLSPDASWYGFALGDVNGDGLDDVVHTFYDYTIFWDECNGVVGLGDGATLAASYPDDVVMFLGAAVQEPQIADLDGDGLGDLVSTPSTYLGAPLQLHASDGLGAFAAPLSLPAAGVATGFAVGDVDGLAADDLVLVHKDAAEVVVVHNRTPLPGLGELGGGLAGGAGVPHLAASGAPEPGALVRVRLTGALPDAECTLVFGLDDLWAPFKGGTLVPRTDLLLGGLQTSPTGELTFALAWPGGLPAGFTTWWQYWIVDPAGPAGRSASNALAIKTS